MPIHPLHQLRSKTMDNEQPREAKQPPPTRADYLIMKQAILEYRARLTARIIELDRQIVEGDETP